MTAAPSGSRASGYPPLSRAAVHATDAPPIRIVHLGLGNFFRAHVASYTANAADAASWGIAAFTGRSTELAAALAAQDGLYTLVVRSAAGDVPQLIAAINQAYSGLDAAALLRHLADPAVAVVTLTITEAGYLRGADGDLDRAAPTVSSDLEALRGWWPQASARSSDAPALLSAPARLVAGLAARRAAHPRSPLAIVSCDNLPDNGRVLATVVEAFARALDPELAVWIAENASFVTTVVDRITPSTSTADLDLVASLTGFVDRVPVVTEPFSEWILSGDFPAGRPEWESAGARFVEDPTPYEERKLWLLNGGHSLLAYLGNARGHHTIADAVDDADCRAWLEDWWDLAGSYLQLPAPEIAQYRRSLLDRFSNPAMRHQLAQIATDGSQKLPVRVLPILRRERAAGRLPDAPIRILAGWIAQLRGSGAPVNDAARDLLLDLAGGDLDVATARVLGFVDRDIGADHNVIEAVVASVRSLTD